ncbi:MAG: hypothetical protein AB1505_27385 [Candidatus Latescibacterota bacterium]
MDWQSVAAILIAGLCGVWVVSEWIRPWRQRTERACTLCDECRALASPEQRLLQIRPPETCGHGGLPAVEGKAQANGHTGRRGLRI